MLDQHSTQSERAPREAMIASCTPVGLALLERIEEIRVEFPRFCARFDAQPRIGNFPWELRLREFYISAARYANGELDADQLDGWAQLRPEQMCLVREDCIRLRGRSVN